MRKAIHNRIALVFGIVAALAMIVAAACADQAPAPAAQPKPANPVVQDDADTPNMFDYMDVATARKFEELTPEWQERAKAQWTLLITEFAPNAPGDWKDAYARGIAQLYQNAKLQGGVKGVAVTAPQDLVDPSKGAAVGELPVVLTLLDPKYTEAYNLTPEGSLIREYVNLRLAKFTLEGWEHIKKMPDVATPQLWGLNAQKEFKMRQMLTSDGDADWLLTRIRSLDADVASEYVAAATVDARIELFRRLMEVEGDALVPETLLAEHGARSAGWSEDDIAKHVEGVLQMDEEQKARDLLTPKLLYLNHFENTLCGDLMRHVVGGDFRSATSSPGKCDIDRVIKLTKQALEDGRIATSDHELQQKIDFARNTPKR